MEGFTDGGRVDAWNGEVPMEDGQAKRVEAGASDAGTR